jgi:NAD(P)-dependent dehydrogenase (short-subunit alcohol dehydrogenase family)
MPSRTYVVTGSASGIGRAACEHLEQAGHRVIDVDLRDASVIADLGTPEGRADMVAAVTAASGGTVDAIVANAGTTANPELCVRVNYFGAVATLEGLRPLLAGSDAPRAVATASSSILNVRDNPIVHACLDGDEPGAVALTAEAHDLLGYPSSKRALARWVRRRAPGPTWAGAGIPLNAVAPGIVDTPMTAPLLAEDDMADLLNAAVPMPLGGHAHPADVARLIAFLADAGNTRITGQVVFVDGGADAVLRGDDIW